MNKPIHLVLLLQYSCSHVLAQAAIPSQNDLNSRMTIVVVLIVCAFCILVVLFSIYNRRSAEAHIGLEAAVIETFPILHYAAVKHLKMGKGALVCAVCLSEFEDHETLRLLPQCYHVFHPQCIDPWLASHLTCPNCRANLATAPENGALSIADLDEIVVNSQSRKNTESCALRLPEELRRQLCPSSVVKVIFPRTGYRCCGEGTSSKVEDVGVLTDMLPPVLASSGGGGACEMFEKVLLTSHESISQLPV